MTDKPSFTDHDLDDLFALAKADGPNVSDDLMARIMGDAQTVAEAAVVTQNVPLEVPHEGLIASLLAMIGGWPAAAGLATATVAGVMIGVASPEAVTDLTANTFGDTTASVFEDILPSYDGFWDEG